MINNRVPKLIGGVKFGKKEVKKEV